MQTFTIENRKRQRAKPSYIVWTYAVLVWCEKIYALNYSPFSGLSFSTTSVRISKGKSLLGWSCFSLFFTVSYGLNQLLFLHSKPSPFLLSVLNVSSKEFQASTKKRFDFNRKIVSISDFLFTQLYVFCTHPDYLVLQFVWFRKPAISKKFCTVFPTKLYHVCTSL